MILPEQVRAARALLGWSQAALAVKAGISTTALNNIENGKADPKLSTLLALRRVVDAAGVEVRSDGSVRLRDRVVTGP
jgi:transcriptional regulator with XRE-family HTH domain